MSSYNFSIDHMSLDQIEHRLDSWFGHETYLQDAYCDAGEQADDRFVQANRDYALAYASFFRLVARRIELLTEREPVQALEWLERIFGQEEREVLLELSM